MTDGGSAAPPWRHAGARDYTHVRAAADLTQADPAIREFWAYCDACRAPGALPSRARFDPTAIAQLLPNVWILDREVSSGALRYRLVGTRIVEAIGTDPTGLYLREFLAPRLATDPGMLERYDFMARTGIATWRKGPAHHIAKLDYRAVENLCVPFSRDSGGVDEIVSLSLFWWRNEGPAPGR